MCTRLNDTVRSRKVSALAFTKNTERDSSTQGPSSEQPSPEQLRAARLAHWHQDEKPLQTLEALREWLNRSGLVLYASRSLQLPSPAPSLVEATLGRRVESPELGEMETARTLMARLIAEGSAVPLNLLGATGASGTDVPDFVVSAGVFSYIFTLRGNKGWKQAPATSGAVKVSPLALAAYEVLAEKVTLSAQDLTTQLGKEVTETAVLRALTELWGQMRVIPVPQLDGSATLWELASSRFTKQIKAGANAGQPTALSALISLYLGQSMVATEEEIETFLSPLAPRSKVRGVIHDLLGARQLDTIVIEGKTLLHVAGDFPAFAGIPMIAEAPAGTEGDVGEGPIAEDGSRIKKFVARPGSKIGTGLRSKPGGKTGSGGKPAFGKKPSFGRAAFGNAGSDRPRPSGDRERRPFRQEDRAASAKPMFNKPWEEEKIARSISATGAESTEMERPARPSSAGGSGLRNAGARAGGERPKFGGKPRFEGKGEGFGGRGKGAGDSRPPRREFSARSEGSGPRRTEGSWAGRPARAGEGTGPRKTFSKPGTFGRKREGFGGTSSFGGGDGTAPRRASSADAERPTSRNERAPRREFGAGAERTGTGGVKRPGSYSPKPRSEAGGGYGAKPSFGVKPSFGSRAGGSDRGRGDAGGETGGPARKVFRKFDAPRDKKPFGAKSSGTKSFGAKPTFDRSARTGDAPRTFDRSRASGEERPRTEGRPKFGSKAGASGAKKPFTKAVGFAASGGPFAKFAGGKKPFRKPGPGKKPTGGGGGLTPTKRKRPEAG